MFLAKIAMFLVIFIAFIAIFARKHSNLFKNSIRILYISMGWAAFERELNYLYFVQKKIFKLLRFFCY